MANMYMYGEKTETDQVDKTGSSGWIDFSQGLSNIFEAATPITETVVDSVSSKKSQERQHDFESSFLKNMTNPIIIPGTNQGIPTWVPIAGIGVLAIALLRKKQKRRRR